MNMKRRYSDEEARRALAVPRAAWNRYNRRYGMPLPSDNDGDIGPTVEWCLKFRRASQPNALLPDEDLPMRCAKVCRGEPKAAKAVPVAA